jgi:hypothetical protein
MSRYRVSAATARWRSLWDSPLVLAAWIAVGCGSVAMVDVGGALRRAREVRCAAMPELTRLAAETALADVLAREPEATFAQLEVGSTMVTVTRGGGEFRLACVVADGGVFRFRCDEVPGAAPEVFAHACSAVDPSCTGAVRGARLIGRDQMPRLDPAQVAQAVRGDQLAAFQLDQGVALLSWESGTEKPDYVVQPSRAAELDGAGGLVVVAGNLWVEVGEKPLRLTLQRDLVVVVRGNVYVGRSIVVDGPGRLVVVASRGAGESSFADVDANGRWSRGDILRGEGDFVGPFEGAGNVYLGLPGTKHAVACDASIVLDGELHVGVAARVAGPLVVGCGATTITPLGGRVEARRDWTFAIDRERVPGFQTGGAPRPGRLWRDTVPPGGGEETLYLSAPAR